MAAADASSSLRERKKRQARQHILATASHLIDNQGYSQTKMRDLAVAAQVSYQTLYNYFPTKALMLQAILMDKVSEISHAMEDLVQAYEGGLVDTLSRLNQIRFSLFSGQERALWKIAALEGFSQAGDADPAYQLADDTAHTALDRLLALARDHGELTAGADAALIAATLSSLTRQAVFNFLIKPSASLDATEATLSAQTTLVISPYLNP